MAYVRSGLRDDLKTSGNRGWMWAASLVVAVAQPPWQSTQPRRTFLLSCIGSMPLWQERQPALLPMACSSVCWSSRIWASGGTKAGGPP